MNYDHAVIEFLSLPENLPTAFEIAKRVDHVKNHLIVRFWRECRDQLNSRLHAADATDRWEVVLASDNKLISDRASCRIAYRSQTSGTMQVEAMLESGQRAANSRLYYGLHWSREIRDQREPAIVEELMTTVRSLGYVGEESAAWPLYIYFNCRLRDETFLLQFTSEPAQVVNEYTDVVWRFFEQIREPLEAANASLTASIA